jgi:hypothetical protein
VANVTFNGSVSAQAGTGETVTIKIIGPTMDTLTAQTQADGTFNATPTKTYLPGNYTAVGHIDADELYSGVDTPVISFQIKVELQPRSATLKLA